MNLDVRRLRILREVALRGTIAAAADSLGFTPSAISQQLSALQREVGASLLERAGRRVRLTREAQILVERTERVLTALEEAQAALEESRGAISGDLRVAASGSVARAFVIPVISDVARAHPDLRVSLLEYEPDESLRELRLGELDLIVAHEYEHDRERAEPDVVRIDLFIEELRLVARRGRFVRPVGLADLSSEIWAAEPADSACGRALRTACRAAGFEPDVRYTTSESSALFSAIAYSGAVSLVPSLACADCPPDLDELPLKSVPTRRLVFAAHRQGNPLRPSIRVLAEHLQAAAHLMRGRYSSKPKPVVRRGPV